MSSKTIREKRRRARKKGKMPQGHLVMDRLQPGGFPRSRVVDMPYVIALDLASTSGSFAVWQFTANSLYDPEVAAGGHQPMGRDQWAAFYNHYVVRSCTIEVDFVHKDNSTPTAALVGIELTDDSTVSSNYAETIEQQKGTWDLLPPTGSARSRQKALYDARSFFNIDDVKDNQDRIGANFGTAATELAIFTVWCQAPDLTTDLGVVTILVRLNYRVEVSEPKDLAGS
jgi:hypothetical protein